MAYIGFDVIIFEAVFKTSNLIFIDFETIAILCYNCLFIPQTRSKPPF